MKKGIVDSEMASGRRVEDCKLSIFYSSPEEIGNRVGMSMERYSIEGGVF